MACHLFFLLILRSEGVPINGPVLKTKAEEFADSLGIDGWTCSNGWLDRWKRRHNIVFKTMSGERASVDETKTDAWVEEVLLPTLNNYEEKDIYNMDETGLFWKLVPDKSFAFKNDRCKGQKKSKDRVTVLLCCNMDGSEKRRPLVIGKFANPRCFRNVTRLPVDYKSNSCAWMTSEIFCEWLLSFDRDMHMQRRKVLLVMDNCSAHKIPEQPLRAVQVLFLPANSTAKLQPCDAGIIRNFKVHYRRMMVLSMLAETVGGGKAKEQRPEFNLRDAVNLLNQSWQKVTPATISNSFRHAGFRIGSAEDGPQEPDPAAGEPEEPEPLLTRLSKEWGISLDEYVSVDNHLPTTEPATLSASATSTSASNVAGTVDSDSSEEDEASKKEAERVSTGEVLGYVRQINLYCLQSGCGDAVTKSFHAFTGLLMTHIVNARHQTRITDFFASPSSDNLNCREDKDSEEFKRNGGEDGDDRSEGGEAGNTRTGAKCEKEKASETKEREMKEKCEGENARKKDEETDMTREREGRKRKKTDSEPSGGKGGWFERKGEGDEQGTKDDSDPREDDFTEREEKRSMQTPIKKRRDGKDVGRGGEKACSSEYGGVGGMSREEWGGGWSRPAEEETGKRDEGERVQGRREDDDGNEARKERDDAYTGIEITKVQNPEPDRFHPTNKEWRKEQCKRLGFPYPKVLPDREIKQQLRPPYEVDKIAGDGNCLYRALSFELCGTQDQHERLKEMLLDFMLENQETFAGYVGGDLGSYLTQHTMQARAWGSDVEIFAAATLLQTTVVVYTAITPFSRKWLTHNPLFRIPHAPHFEEKIYLRNLCGHFERVSSIL